MPRSVSPFVPLLAVLGLVAVACSHPDLDRRIDALEVEADRQAVIRLIHQYAQGIDRNDDALLRRTFTSDAVAEYKGVNFPMNERLEGFPAILKWLQEHLGADAKRTNPLLLRRCQDTDERALGPLHPCPQHERKQESPHRYFSPSGLSGTPSSFLANTRCAEPLRGYRERCIEFRRQILERDDRG